MLLHGAGKVGRHVLLLPWVAVEVGHGEEVSHLEVVEGRTLHGVIVKVVLLSGGHLLLVRIPHIAESLTVFLVA